MKDAVKILDKDNTNDPDMQRLIREEYAMEKMRLLAEEFTNKMKELYKHNLKMYDQYMDKWPLHKQGPRHQDWAHTFEHARVVFKQICSKHGVKLEE